MTRYPKGNKGSKWTIKELDAINAEWIGDKLNDGGGLSGEVRVNSEKVSIVFRCAFKWQGKVTWHYCGTYPTSDMATIRGERDKARALIKAGIDPRAEKIATKIEAQALIEATIKADEQKRSEALTFADLFSAWIKDGVARGDGNKYLVQSYNKYSAPALAKIEVRHLTEHHLRDLYRSVIALGKTATAIKLSTDIGQMLRWAEKRKPWRPLLIDGNPSVLVEIEKIVPDDYDPVRTRQLSLEEIRKLRQIFVTMDLNYTDAPRKYEVERPLKPEVQIALWLCLGTVCRIGELLMTKWRNVDFEKRTWFIPAPDTKGDAGDQLVYLSNFTLAQFKSLHALTGDSEYAFPARLKGGHVCLKSVSKQVGDRQVKFTLRARKLKNRVANNSLVLGDEEWSVGAICRKA